MQYQAANRTAFFTLPALFWTLDQDHSPDFACSHHAPEGTSTRTRPSLSYMGLNVIPVIIITTTRNEPKSINRIHSMIVFFISASSFLS